MSQRSNKLLDRVRDAIQRKHYSYHTERRYVERIRQFILFHNKRHPSKMGAPELEAFLNTPGLRTQVRRYADPKLRELVAI